MKISRLPTIYKDVKPLLSGICNEAKSLLEQRKAYTDRMNLIRDNYTSKINIKAAQHTSIRNDNITIVDNYFTNLTNTYFITNNADATKHYIRSRDNIGVINLRYKQSINFIQWIYKAYYTQPTSATIISNYYKTYIQNDQTYQFEQLDFYPVQNSGIPNIYPDRRTGMYSSEFYTQSQQVYNQINSISKYTYMLNGYNNRIIPTPQQFIQNMTYYNSLNTNYTTNLDLDIKNKLNQKRNELNRLINKLRYDKSYNYKELQTIKKLISTEFAVFKNTAQHYNTQLQDYIGTVYMTQQHMQYQMTWQDYQLYPNENTIWRIDVIDNASGYITNVYPPAKGDTLRDGSYGDNFYNKAVFSQIFNM